MFEKEKLKHKAKWIRRQILEMCSSISGGHLASSLSCVEILTTLYYCDILKFNINDLKWDERDRFILSKGHGAPALYPILADLGFIDMEELGKFCKAGCYLGSHPNTFIPGVECISGSLGHGLGIGTGLALRAKLDKKNYVTVVLISDGECYEGSTWETATFASYCNLNNLIAIMDYNRISATDFTYRLDPLFEKWKIFGWNVIEVDGHSFESLFDALIDIHSNKFKPLIIIAKTTKGKGISFLENNILAHTMIPTGDKLEMARRELSE